MAKSEARRQKQLAKKKAKRDDKRLHLARASSIDPTIRLAKADSWPVVEALVPDEIWERGMGQVSLCRRCPDGQLACAYFVIDAWCLGVKNAHWEIITQSQYEAIIRRSERANGAMRTVTPEHLAKLVYAAVEYAHSFGFAPHADYRPARLLLAGIDPSQCNDTFEFGHEGKPFFVQGPYDSEDKVRSILRRLEMVEGHYLVGAKAGDLLLDADDQDVDEDLQDPRPISP